MRKIRPRGFWSANRKVWEFPLGAWLNLKQELGSRFVVQDDLANWLNCLENPLPPLPIHRVLVEKAELHTQLSDGRIPFLHQCSGARWLLARRGAVLADEMGLGKTLTALLAARGMVRSSHVKVLVVAPVGLHAHWWSEAKSLDLIIELHSWASLPVELLSSTGTLLIVDEAHFAQSLNAKRTKALLRLARHPRLQAIWMLTGTPMKNGRPAQLYPLLAAIDHPLARDQRKFEEYFCQDHCSIHSGQRKWSSFDVTNLEDLRNHTRQFILHRKKKALIGLRPKNRKFHQIKLKGLEAIGFQHRISLVVEDYRYRVQQGLVRSETESLAVLTAMRQISSEFKLPVVSSFLTDLIVGGQQVVLFSNFIQPLLLLQQKIGGELLTGLQTINQRLEIVQRFQKGLNPLLLASYGVGGLGFSLQTAKHVVLLERPWTPGDVEQAEDRCHRIGMQDSLTSHWFQLGLADQLVDGILESKAKQIDILLGNRRITIERQSMPSMFTRFMQESFRTINS